MTLNPYLFLTLLAPGRASILHVINRIITPYEQRQTRFVNLLFGDDMWDLDDLLQEIATITRRWPLQRIRFLEEYVFAPKHAELLRTRESKRENDAFDRGEYLDPDENFQRRA